MAQLVIGSMGRARRAAGSTQCPHVLRSLSGSDPGLIWSLHPVISPLLTQVSHKEHPCAVERNTAGVVLSIPALPGSVSEGVPWKRGLFDHYFSFILFLHLAIWFSLFPLLSISADFPLLKISDIYTLNFCWLYCWTFSVIKNKDSGSGNAGRYLHLVQAPWIFPLRSGLWWTVCGTNLGRPSGTGGFHAFEDHSLSFLPVFSIKSEAALKVANEP